MSNLRPILLADDNPMDVDLTLRAFRRNKLTNPIEVARDGEEVLAWIGRWERGEPRPVVVLLDINMPKIDGLTGCWHREVSDLRIIGCRATSTKRRR